MAMADSKPFSHRKPSRFDERRGFTIVELLVATGISSFVLVAVLATMLQLVRSSTRVTQYAEMDTQVRRTFEQLGVDVKAASAFTYNSASNITVTVAESDGTSSQFTYAWDSATKIFYRVAGADSASVTGRVKLMTGVNSLAFTRLTTSGGAATTDNATKRVKISLTVKRTATGAASSSSTVATSFVLRNKPAS
jgi:prepilin-type N-terminal cleavage/methylation domain-containing protein